MAFATIVNAKLFEEAHWTAKGLVCFVYRHANRTPVWVWVETVGLKIRYIRATGIPSEWHGEAFERGELGRLVAVNGHKNHEIWFLDFHSPYGSKQDIRFKQSSSNTWQGTHGRTRDCVWITLITPVPALPQQPPTQQPPQHEILAIEDMPVESSFFWC